MLALNAKLAKAAASRTRLQATAARNAANVRSAARLFRYPPDEGAT